MKERLFVYGTLGPGRPNQHILKAIGGCWDLATIRGDLREEGWGAELGYPGIELNEQGGIVEGFVFSSENLSNHWDSLDKFEGTPYQRILTKVKLKNKIEVNAYLYTLKST